MTPSIPTIDIVPFSMYSAYLAALLNDLTTTPGHSQFEVYGMNVNSVEGDVGGDESVEIGPVGNVVNLIFGALRETLVKIWGKGTWNEVSTAATRSFGVHTA